MSALPFLLFAAFFAAMVYLHFCLAHREWRRSRGSVSGELDQDYVRMEDYFGRSFRLKVKEWLAEAGAEAAAQGGVKTSRAGEFLRVSGSLEWPPGTAAPDVLMVQGDFSCGPDCELTRELYALGNCRIGARSRLQALAADGSVFLEPGVLVMRWLDAEGGVEIGEDCEIHGRVSSRKTVRLAAGARVGSVCAVEIAACDVREPGEAPSEPTSESVVIPPLAPDALKEAGADPRRLVRLSADTWVYDGDLRLKAPLDLRTKLVVKGHLRCPGRSILREDVKAVRSLVLGEHCWCRGSLVAGTDVIVGAGSRFEGVIHAGREVRLGSGTRGLRDGAPVVVSARGKLYLEDNVVVRGKLSSADCVVALAALAAAEAPMIEPPRAEFAGAERKTAV